MLMPTIVSRSWPMKEAIFRSIVRSVLPDLLMLNCCISIATLALPPHHLQKIKVCLRRLRFTSLFLRHSLPLRHFHGVSRILPESINSGRLRQRHRQTLLPQHSLLMSQMSHCTGRSIWPERNANRLENVPISFPTTLSANVLLPSIFFQHIQGGSHLVSCVLRLK